MATLAASDINIQVTSDATALGGSPTVTWTLPSPIAGAAAVRGYYQIGAYRSTDRTPGAPLNQAAPPPFDYIPVAATGYPNLVYGAVPDPILVGPLPASFTFTGAFPSTRALPNGSYIIWLHVIARHVDSNEDVLQEDSGVATATITITTSTAAEPLRIRRTHTGSRPALDPPTIITPTAGSTVTGGAVGATFRVPQGVSPSHFMLAVYRFEDYDQDTREGLRNPVVASGLTEGRAEAERVSSLPFDYDEATRTWTANFGTTPGLPDLVPNSTGEGWVLVIRYAWEAAAHILSYDPRTGLVRERHVFLTSQSAFRVFKVTGSTDYTGPPPDPYVYVPSVGPGVTWPQASVRAEVSENLRLRWIYGHRRGIGQRSVQIRRDLAGASNAGTRYLALTRNTAGRLVPSWVTALDTSSAATTDIVGRDFTHTLLAGTDAARGWGGLAWGVHTFSVRATSDSGEVSAFSRPLVVDVYRRLSILTLTATVTSGFVVVAWTHDGATGNTRQARYRVQLFNPTTRKFITGTTDGQSTDHARALLGAALTWTADRSANSLGPPPNGTWQVVLTLWDIDGNEVQRAVNVQVANTAPADDMVSIAPRVYDHNHLIVNDPATGMPAVTGLHPGAYVGVGITFTSTAGLWGVRLERREFSRSDGLDADDEPRQVAELPLGTATALGRFSDDEADHGVEYQYRAIAVAVNGAETTGDWTPA